MSSNVSDWTNAMYEEKIKERTSEWISTFTGGQWFFFEPRPEDVRIDDIAHSLALCCRFGGHAKFHYSIAQHCVLIFNELLNDYNDPEIARWGLLHDATEAYLGDVVRPLKGTMRKYKALEKTTEGVILAGLNLPEPSKAARELVHQYDNHALVTEHNQLVNDGGHKWHNETKPFKTWISQWTPGVAEQEYLKCWNEVRP